MASNVRRPAAVVGLALLALLTGCASDTSGAGTDPGPPVLYLAGSSGGETGAGTGGLPAAMTKGTGSPTLPGGSGGRGLSSSGYRVVVTLPSGPAAAPVYRFPAQLQVGAVRALAAALHLSDPPLRHAYGWEVRGPGGAVLRVRDDGAGQWSYVRTTAAATCAPQVDLDAGQGSRTVCSSGPVPPPAPASAGSAGSAISSASAGSPTVPAGPSTTAARTEAAAVLAAVGLSAQSAQVQVGSPVTRVSADPVVGGLPTTGLTTTLTVDHDGVLTADGWLGTPAEGADYPLVTAAQALRSLSLMVHPMVPGTAEPAIAIACPVRGGTVPGGTVRGGTVPGGTVAGAGHWCGGPIQITGARLGLALSYEDTGPILVPAWLFSTSGEYRSGQPTYPIVVIAVQPRYFATPGPPTATTVPEPTVPGSTGAGSGGGQTVPGQTVPGQPAAPLPTPGQLAGHGVGPG